MYLARLSRRSSVKVRIDGPDKDGKNTSRQIMLCDAHVDEVVALLKPIFEEATRKAAEAREAQHGE